jgi:formylglycine-generating enzyme required for sulfatase activity
MRLHHALSSCVALVALGSAASAVTMEWTVVGNPGNACDAQPQGCFGAVPYAYQIGTYEVTKAQYAEFLNAKASVADPYDLSSDAPSCAVEVRARTATARSRCSRTPPSTI